MSQKQCLPTKGEFRKVKTERYGNKRTYESLTKDGGTIKLTVKKPVSKLIQKIRDIFFKRAKA